jgi:hypothetical protein
MLPVALILLFDVSSEWLRSVAVFTVPLLIPGYFVSALTSNAFSIGAFGENVIVIIVSWLVLAVLLVIVLWPPLKIWSVWRKRQSQLQPE